MKSKYIIIILVVTILISILLRIQKDYIIKNIKVENIENNQITLKIDNNYYIYE